MADIAGLKHIAAADADDAGPTHPSVSDGPQAVGIGQGVAGGEGLALGVRAGDADRAGGGMVDVDIVGGDVGGTDHAGGQLAGDCAAVAAEAGIAPGDYRAVGA
ncbi:hypothetical protein AADEFJLK_04647 [Methylovulum psychrotolerans]|uniref:Uncharacterized protein n=1 Tax=Methylovulum psychrotolerans TaxID=1704499 RepID=A0A2S5CFP3_9GAMM|nr:hypothetical protein AADEFJLK_04647 [Methylovulum psychrotolerans]